MVPSSAAEVQPVVAVVALGWVLSNPVWALSWWYVVHAPLGTMGVAARWFAGAAVGAAACATDTALKATLRQAAATRRSPFTPASSTLDRPVSGRRRGQCGDRGDLHGGHDPEQRSE